MTFQNTPAIALAAAAVSFFAMADVLAAALPRVLASLPVAA